MEVLIDNEIKNLLPGHSEESYRRLRVKTKREGCPHEFPVYTPDGGHTHILLDGHTTRQICLDEKIPIKGYRIVEEVTTRQQALEWVIENQLGRRNLTESQFKYYLGKLYRRPAAPFLIANDSRNRSVRSSISLFGFFGSRGVRSMRLGNVFSICVIIAAVAMFIGFVAIGVGALSIRTTDPPWELLKE